MLADDLGIDLTLEAERYEQFLRQAVDVILPIGWKVETTPPPEKTVYYYNELDGIFSYHHPCLEYFATIMKGKYKE